MSLLLLFGGTPNNYQLTAEGGSYTLTGQSAGLSKGLTLTADGGAYALTGQNADIIFAGATNYTLTCLGGEYSITGTDVHIDAPQAPQTFGNLIWLTGPYTKQKRKQKQQESIVEIAEEELNDLPEIDPYGSKLYKKMLFLEQQYRNTYNAILDQERQRFLQAELQRELLIEKQQKQDEEDALAVLMAMI